MNSSAGNYTTVVVQPTISTSAYAANDQLGGLQTLSQAALGDDLYCQVANLIIVDKDKQDAPIVVYFFNEAPTLISSDNDVLDISDAEMVQKCTGFISVGSSDYTDLNANSVAMINYPLTVKSNGGRGTIYAIAKCGGTPTYTSTGSLYFKYCFSKQF